MMKAIKPTAKTADLHVKPPIPDPFGRWHADRDIEQAITALKKGTRLLKYGRLGKPRACYFRLSPDEQDLLYLSGGDKEKSIALAGVSKIVPGQITAVFHRYPRPEKESLSFSLIYQNGERSMDVICKDSEEFEIWFMALHAIVSHTRIGAPSGNNSGSGRHSKASTPTPFSAHWSSLESSPGNPSDSSPGTSPFHTFEPPPAPPPVSVTQPPSLPLSSVLSVLPVPAAIARGHSAPPA